MTSDHINSGDGRVCPDLGGEMTKVASSSIADNEATTNDGRQDLSKAASALIIAASDKAGMEGIDRSRIDAIILRESGNSAYMKQQRKRDEQVNKRIEKMLQELNAKNERSGGDKWKRSIEQELQSEMEVYLSLRHTRSSCVVVDMDMFYMACELLTRPELKDKPCCVGGGMITTSNYVARKYGVRSAMAGFIADKLVEELSGGKEKLIHIPNNFHLYTEKSHEVRKVLSEYDPNMKAYSLDEAYLNIGPYLALRLQGQRHGDIVSALTKETNDDDKLPALATEIDECLSVYPPYVALTVASEVVQEMRRRVFESTGLTCSAGIAPNFMLAKIASDRNKPNGQLAVGPDHQEIIDFLYPLPTRKVGGIGRVTEKMLHALGINTVQDLYNERATVRFSFKPATARFLLRTSLGCSGHESKDGEDDDLGQKGISRERTFTSGRPWAEINDKLEEIARMLSEDMKKRNIFAHTVTVKVKLHSFDVMSRSRSLARGVYLQCADDLVRISSELLREVRQHFQGTVFSVRLLGVRCSNFQVEQERLGNDQMNIVRYFSGQTDQNKTLSGNVDRKLQNVVNETPYTDQKGMETVQCPLCGKRFKEDDNLGLNSHVDTCLSGSVIREATRAKPQPKKKLRLTDFFVSSA